MQKTEHAHPSMETESMNAQKSRLSSIGTWNGASSTTMARRPQPNRKKQHPNNHGAQHPRIANDSKTDSDRKPGAKNATDETSNDLVAEY
jgi:hypothetical protein